MDLLHPVAFWPVVAHLFASHALEVLNHFHWGGNHAAGASGVEHGGLTFGGKAHVVDHLTFTLFHAQDALDAFGELADDFVGERPQRLGTQHADLDACLLQQVDGFHADA